MSKADRDLIELHMCRFDYEVFFDLGRDILCLIEDNRYESRVLRHR